MNNIIILLSASLLIAILIGVAIYIILNESFFIALQKNRIINSLRQRKTDNSNDNSLGRFIRHMIEQFHLEKFFNVEQINKNLSNLGASNTTSIDTILMAKIFMPFFVAFFIFYLDFAKIAIDEKNTDYKIISFIVSLVLGILTFPVPEFLIGLDAKKRANEFMSTFPAIIDLLLICIQCGISFEHSLQRVTGDAAVLSPVTGEELSRILRDIHLLGSREKALMNFKSRIPMPAVDDFVLVVLQSERYGTSMTDAFRVLAETVRNEQMMVLERKVLKLPTIISFLVTIFLLPSVMLLIFAPLILGGFGG